MNPKYFFLLSVLFVLVSCREKETISLTENDLKLVPILVDVYTIEAALRTTQDADVQDSLRQVYFDQLYQIHHIDKEWLDEERKRLEADPVRMDSVYSRALVFIEKYKSRNVRVK